MKVGIAVPAFLPARDYGGPVQVVLQLQPALARLGVQVTVVTSTLASIGRATLPAGPDNVGGIEVLRLRTPFSHRFSPFVVWRKVPRFDVLHVFGAWNGLSYAALSVGRRGASGTLWEPLGMLVARGRHASLKRSLRLFHRSLMRSCDGIIWTSKREYEEAHAACPTPSFFRPNPCAPLDPAGLPDRLQARVALGLQGPGPLWGYLGRIDERKGIDRLLRTWPGASAGRLVVAGPVGNRSLGSQVAALGRGVLRYPALSSEERWLYLRALDALVLVPDFGENFGNVVVEALQAGTPVVVSSAVGCLDWIDDPAVRVVDGDVELRRVFAHGELPPAPLGLPAACRPEQVAATQLDIYERILAAPRA